MSEYETAHKLATEAAVKAAAELEDNTGGHMWGACGFAWVKADVDGRSRTAKELKKIGFRKSYGGGLDLWNPSKHHTQNIDIKEVGAMAYADMFTELTGVKVYAQSRLD